MIAVLFFLVCQIFAFTSSKRALNDFVDGNKKFAVTVYQGLGKIFGDDDNLLVSPLSASIILALVQSGAKGSTRMELIKGLRLPHDQIRIETAIKGLGPLLTTNGDFIFESANKIYIKNNFEIKDMFKDIAIDVFGSELQNIDFSNSEDAAKVINEWVQDNTEDKIKDLISSDSIDETTRAVLVNALYFKANWSIPFDPELTTKDDFYRSSRDVIQVDTMHFEKKVNYFENKELGVKFLELGFLGHEIAMVFVLPNKTQGLQYLEDHLEQVVVRPSWKLEQVKIAIPKFKIESRIDFKTVLKSLGVTKIFDPSEADLSGIAGEKGEIVISEIVQQTFIDVEENGVEAAAATGVIVTAYSLPAFEEPTKEFIANHPFLFYIRIKDLIVFVGRVVTPQH